MPRRVKKSWKTGLIDIGHDCYAYIQSGGLNVSNAGLVVGLDSCLVIDTLYIKPMTQAFQRSIRKVTKKPVGQIVCTHHHADHTLGLNWFPRDIPVIAHRYMRERMIETGLNLAHYRRVNPEYRKHLRGLKQYLPTQTYEGSMTLYLGDRCVELHNLGHAHSKGDSMVYLPKERILYSGDFCFNFVTPATFDAYIGNWIRKARMILKTFPLQTVVPGHGPVGDRRVIEDMIGYLSLVQREARKRFKAGMPAKHAAKEIPLGVYAEWIKPDRVEQAVMKLYNEFRGQDDKGISLDAAKGG
jgi:glyoxylase-like metal-dependent hydrolase (beta-lactamase superfamily II)